MKEIIRSGVTYEINPNSAKLYEFTNTEGGKSYMVVSGGMNLELTLEEYNNFKNINSEDE